MSLRPRYSLLTLLLLTALVAGGVKLWYGPHHVVERIEGELEDEYSYTRDWQGNRIIHGIRINRTFDQEQLSLVEIQYYQHGRARPLICLIAVFPHRPIHDRDSEWLDGQLADLPEPERQEWKQAINRERGKVFLLPHEIDVVYWGPG